MNDAPSPAPVKRKLTAKERDMVSLVVEGLLLVVFIGISAAVWSAKHATVTTHTVVVSGSPIPSAKPTPVVAKSTIEQLVIPMDRLAAGYSLSLQAPVVWRAVDVRDLMSLQDYPDYNGGDLAALLRFVPENAERSTLFSTVEPINTLDVLVTSRWVTEDPGDPASPANKRAYLAYLGSLKTVEDIASKKCTPITFGGSVCTDKKVKPQIVKTADGAVSGLMYLYMPTQSVSYDPSVIVEMAGTVAGKPVHVRGVFRLYDKLYETLGANGAKTGSGGDWVNKVQSARTAFSNAPADDTMAMYDRIAVAVKGMSFSKK
jgi:hypothetical protein